MLAHILNDSITHICTGHDPMAEEAQRLPPAKCVQIGEALLLQIAVFAKHQTQIGQVHNSNDTEQKVNCQNVWMAPFMSVVTGFFAGRCPNTSAEHCG